MKAVNNNRAQYAAPLACRSVDAALRRSIPAFNKDVKDVQTRMEDNAYKLRIPQRKPWQQMAENVTASVVLAQQPEKVCSAAHCGEADMSLH